ncbi:TasA family protein [Halomicrobium salinisoli]|uniref:TasA family protein n=1 Tax=Halomicrobium salinisoli TaxID=2878391 RepID=UPI001CF0CF5D|nr:TasA family protein [Halomicrobium salinisoli]
MGGPDDERDPIMSEKRIELTRRRVLGGIATIGAASAAAGAGTFAYFSDEETSSTTVSAGTLDLQTGSTNTLSFGKSDIVPGQNGSGSVDLQKSGSVAGDLSISVASVSSSEGTDSDAETNTSTSDGGELDDQLELALWIGTGGSSDTSFESGDIALRSDGNLSDTKTFGTASNYDGASWGNVVTDFSGPVTFNLEWKFPDGDTNNEAQGDDITVSFDFTLEQQQ